MGKSKWTMRNREKNWRRRRKTKRKSSKITRSIEPTRGKAPRVRMGPKIKQRKTVQKEVTDTSSYMLEAISIVVEATTVLL